MAAAAKSHGVPGAKVFFDYKELPVDPGIDVALVLTSNESHGPIHVDAPGAVGLHAAPVWTHHASGATGSMFRGPCCRRERNTALVDGPMERTRTGIAVPAAWMY